MHEQKAIQAVGFRIFVLLFALFAAFFIICPGVAHADIIEDEETTDCLLETEALSSSATNIDNETTMPDDDTIAQLDTDASANANESLENQQDDTNTQEAIEDKECSSSNAEYAELEGVGASGGEDEDALYDPEVVEVKSDQTIPDPQDYVTYRKTSGNYEVILSGVNDANKEALANAIFENLEKGVPVKFVNEDFVDADKYSTTCEQFDKYHCWLGSTSNILTYTGWASQYTNPLTGEKFANEDELFSFMSSSFSDANGLPNSAYSYFFDGLFGGMKNFWIRTNESSAIKPFAGTSHTGFDPDVCSAALIERLELDSSFSALEALDGLADHALEMTIAGATSHSVTVMGAVIDTTKSGAERYVAILIADTDNEPSTSDNPPSSFEEANNAKRNKTNSYTMYHLGIGEVDGQTVVLFKNYLKYKSGTIIGSFTQVPYYSAVVRQSALETASNATRNAKTTADIALSSLSVFDETYETKDAYELSDKLTLQTIIIGMNANVEFNAKNTGHDFLENSIEVYRDGVLVGTIEKAAWISLAQGINCSNGEYHPIDLSSFEFLKQPGSYTLKFFLNTSGIPEAYVLNNNSPQSVSFIIKGNDDSENEDGPDDNNAAQRPETTNQRAEFMRPERPYEASPSTGDSGRAFAVCALALALLSLFALCACRARVSE